jgi:hypothetical protein
MLAGLAMFVRRSLLVVVLRKERRALVRVLNVIGLG